MSETVRKLSVRDHDAVIFSDGSWRIRKKTFLGYVIADEGCAKNPAEAKKQVADWERKNK